MLKQSSKPDLYKLKFHMQKFLRLFVGWPSAVHVEKCVFYYFFFSDEKTCEDSQGSSMNSMGEYCTSGSFDSRKGISKIFAICITSAYNLNQYTDFVRPEGILFRLLWQQW